MSTLTFPNQSDVRLICDAADRAEALSKGFFNRDHDIVDTMTLIKLDLWDVANETRKALKTGDDELLAFEIKMLDETIDELAIAHEMPDLLDSTREEVGACRSLLCQARGPLKVRLKMREAIAQEG
jgi:hypothetical protein